ncbi:MAG: NAD(P)/FAD-dependent oxidoreductase [Myxococcota bacterium]
MRTSADVVVIGGGIMGLSLAYNLACIEPARVITVLEASYLCSGASGRNGGGVRAQWANELSVRLMQESLQEFRGFARKHRINTWFRQGGYLFLARNAERAAELERSVGVQRRCGLDTELCDASRIAEIAPEISSEGVLLASYNANDAVVFPWPFVWGYAEGARSLGVEIETFTRVVGIDVENGSVRRVHTDRGSITTSVVVVACGALSPEVTRMAGVELPTHPHRHEICSTEPLKPFLTPLVADLTDGLYFSQSTRGEIVGGISDPKTPPGARQDSSARFLALYARALVSCCPRLAAVGVLRQWAGLYDISPDQGPILGRVDSPDGLFVTSGFMGHGFMMAPVVGKRLAALIAKGTSSAELDAWRLARFREGRPLAPDMIIG